MNRILTEKDTQAVNQILAEQLSVRPDQLTREANIQDDLGADSLDVVEITMALEQHFTLTIPDERWDQVKTVSDLHEALAELLQKK